jgi:hypothetical protein
VIEPVGDPPVADPNANPFGTPVSVRILLFGVVGSAAAFIDRFANVSRLCWLYSSKDLSRVDDPELSDRILSAARTRLASRWPHLASSLIS